MVAARFSPKYHESWRIQATPQPIASLATNKIDNTSGVTTLRRSKKRWVVQLRAW